MNFAAASGLGNEVAPERRTVCQIYEKVGEPYSLSTSDGVVSYEQNGRVADPDNKCTVSLEGG